MKTKSKLPLVQPTSNPFNNAFDSLASATAPSSPPTPEVTAKSAPPPPRGKVVVRREKKGRGGKTVTVVTGITTNLEENMKSLQKALGCGAAREDSAMVFQGWQGERLAELLRERGYTNIVVSN